jgi:hypothetical protein
MQIKENARGAMWMSAGCMPAAWHIAGMKKGTPTVTDTPAWAAERTPKNSLSSDDGDTASFQTAPAQNTSRLPADPLR